MYENNHFKNLEKDMDELSSLTTKIKQFVCFFSRPVAHILIKNYLRKLFKDEIILKEIDKFLLNEGGMFKNYVYKVCDQFYPIYNSSILVPGCGYGRNLIQLAYYKPKEIIAFDLYAYPEEWKYLSKIIKQRFNVKVSFLRGDFKKITKKYKNYFDFIISDAVLEHVKNLNSFAKDSYKVLKKKGIFYASFGPIWFGPSGDHIFWGEEKIFDHLILPKKDYEKKFKQTFPEISTDSCEGAFLVKTRLFSYLSACEYLEILSKVGFKKLLLFAKISTKAISLLKNKSEIDKLLDKKKIPKFDRYCSGIYLWMRK